MSCIFAFLSWRQRVNQFRAKPSSLPQQPAAESNASHLTAQRLRTFLNPSRSSHLLQSRVWCGANAQHGCSALKLKLTHSLHDRTLTYGYLARKGLDRGLRSGRYWICVFAALFPRVLSQCQVRCTVCVSAVSMTAGQYPPLDLFIASQFASSS